MELREQHPLEKIKVKDLCARAQINKSTFYSHYQDMFALSAALEDELFEQVLSALPEMSGVDLSLRADWLARQLFEAFVKNQREVNILFSGSRQGLFVNGIETALRERVARADPTYWNDPARGVLLSFCVQGGFYAFANNSAQIDQKRLVNMVAAISRAAQNCVRTEM